MTDSRPKKLDRKTKRLPAMPPSMEPIHRYAGYSHAEALSVYHKLRPAKNRSKRQWRKLIKRELYLHTACNLSDYPRLLAKQQAQPRHWDLRVAEAMWMNHLHWQTVDLYRDTKDKVDRLLALGGFASLEEGMRAAERIVKLAATTKSTILRHAADALMVTLLPKGEQVVVWDGGKPPEGKLVINLVKQRSIVESHGLTYDLTSLRPGPRIGDDDA